MITFKYCSSVIIFSLKAILKRMLKLRCYTYVRVLTLTSFRFTSNMKQQLVSHSPRDIYHEFFFRYQVDKVHNNKINRNSDKYNFVFR